VNKRRLTWLVLLVVATCATVYAHDFSQSESTLTIDGSAVRVQLSLNLLDLPYVDSNGNGVVSYEELDATIERVFAAVKTHYVLGAPGSPLRTALEHQEIVEDHVLRMDLRYDFADDVRQIDVTSTLDAMLGPMHQHFLTANIDSETMRTVLDAGNRQVRFDRSRILEWRIGVLVAAGFAIALLAWFRRRR
jgi:hypothetical protein